MSSANGFILEVDNASGHHELRASWAAPFFVLELNDPEEGDDPSLCHCDDIHHARRRMNLGFGRNVLLDSKFNELECNDAGWPIVGLAAQRDFENITTYADKHECGQLRLAVPGEQVSLLPLPDSLIPVLASPYAEPNPIPPEYRGAAPARRSVHKVDF